MTAKAIDPQSYYSQSSSDCSSARKLSLAYSKETNSESRGGLMKELLSMSDGVRVCSRLHSVVHEFRSAHASISANAKNRGELLKRLTLDKLPSDQAEAISRLSTPATYAELRHGGRLLSPYPPLAASELASLCEEIRAALVWKTNICDA